MKKIASISFLILGLILILLETTHAVPSQAQTSTSLYLPLIRRAATTSCRFGIAAIPGIGGYDVSLNAFKIGGFVDWTSAPSRTLPGDVTFLRVINLRDPFDDTEAAQYAARLARVYPGSYWQIGNEPDTTYEGHGIYQDNVTANQYGHRYYVIASAIRQADPSAKLGFGSVVQPTPVRFRYLEMALARLISDSGSASAAHGLIDFISIHGFILNEDEDHNDDGIIDNKWGTGVPKDYSDPYLYCLTTNPDGTCKTKILPEALTPAQTYDINRFKTRVQNMRQWMYNNGLRNKPLWITEYGSLLPPITKPEDNLTTLPDSVTAQYMVNTFDFLRTATSTTTGLPADGNRLVQRWFWYSLNEHRYWFGGSLYDPDTSPPQLTLIGQTFINYMAPLLPEEGCLP
jgi:hypothetical protein